VTLWYDFTTSLRNTGRNGIAAVEWNLGTAMVESDVTTRCFALRDRRGLMEIDRNADLGAAFYASGTAVAPPRVISSVQTWRGSLRAMVAPRFGRYAEPVGAALARAYSWPIHARGWMSRSLDRTLSSIRRPPLALQVGASDVVVSVGADWSGALLERLQDLKRRTGCRVVTMVYDVIPLTHPHLAFHNEPALFASYYSRLADVSDLVMCISEQSRRDFNRLATECGWRVPDTVVLRLGETAPATVVDGAREDFYLWVGTIERRKNLELVYDALRIIESEGHVVPTVLVAGAVGWGVDDLIAELDLQSTAASRSLIRLGPVDEFTLDDLYRRARALVFPSHYEGWGLPVREAAVRGCPVAAGDSPAVREAIEGYVAGQLLPVDDPGPWADFLRSSSHQIGVPAAVRTWPDAAADLGRFVKEIA
jgi:glycosyltransferase involved in cell wall biosynthesis